MALEAARRRCVEFIAAVTTSQQSDRANNKTAATTRRERSRSFDLAQPEIKSKRGCSHVRQSRTVGKPKLRVVSVQFQIHQIDRHSDSRRGLRGLGPWPLLPAPPPGTATCTKLSCALAPPASSRCPRRRRPSPDSRRWWLALPVPRAGRPSLVATRPGRVRQRRLRRSPRSLSLRESHLRAASQLTNARYRNARTVLVCSANKFDTTLEPGLLLKNEIYGDLTQSTRRARIEGSRI